MSKLALGQNYSYKNEQFDLKIYEYLSKTIERDSITLETFIYNTKPFSKWDIRPLKDKEVWAMDTVYSSSMIPNFIWGSFANQYKLTQQAAMAKPNELLNKAVADKEKLTNYLKLNLKKFQELSQSISKSKNQIYLNQITIQRVDSNFKENNIYWKYSISKESPFPISDKIIASEKPFSNNQTGVLNLMHELGIYSAIKTKDGIFYLIDGFTDNSYGFFYSSTGLMESDNNLFEIMTFEKITDNYFYYIAN